MRLRVPPLVWFVLFGGLIAVSALVPGLQLAPLPWFGLTFAILGLGLAGGAVADFQRRKTTVDPRAPGRATALLTRGVFRLTRNPIYVGMALCLFGLALALGTVLGLFLTLGFIAALTAWQIRPEEKALRSLFGPDYDDYAAKVPRWLLV
ncbi:methyltransferase family protein [Parvularcula dongshanensis]|uniref:Protein-S-isoprenylcysteine O-methyltransferase Ste14 n=1 Tax=Parvularcula dongshanensis TaxID=1173995 RepID=A0A840I1A8_9PROT|nr:isoprenylcysteine carboxylmethyltransferase family protein [Parvularcula dongshanensis]MBB4658063.1 protein-S-isoprenylcysteine O-methyltransferase Ste14 [Parvularcula dongshanensis]